MAFRGEILQRTDAFEKEAAKYRHLFKGQQQRQDHLKQEPGGVTWISSTGLYIPVTHMTTGSR